MHKVIVERPRRGSRGPYRGIPWEKNADLDNLPAKEGVRKRHVASGARKELNENLAPLKRYLQKQVGRPWNSVYRDISAGLKATSAVQQHVRDHVWDYVHRQVTIEGRNHVVRGPPHWPWRHAALRAGELYIHPTTGILTAVKRGRRDKPPARKKTW
jgi:hypothetical protein